jgi:hypothetical protein
VPRVAGATLAALLTVAVLSGCSGDGDDGATPDPGPSVSSTLPASTSTSATEPALAGAPLVVAEQGVSSFPDPYDIRSTLGSYGVVLQNPNADLMAAGVRVTTRVLDASGVELLVDRTLLNGVMPNQRMALGRTLIEPIVAPTQLEVIVEVGAWLRPAAPGAGLVAEGTVTEPEPNGGAVTRFTVRSTWPAPEEGVDVTAIYRAADGRIVGAESTTLELVSPQTPTEGRIRLLAPIADVASTEVFVGRGLAAQTIG